MKLSSLTPASDHEVEKWLKEKLDLTDYQKEKLRDREIIRFAPFYFYKRAKPEKVGILWRLTIIFFAVYLILLFCSLPFKMIITGKWGYGRKFIDNFHNKWVRKLNL